MKEFYQLESEVTPIVIEPEVPNDSKPLQIKQKELAALKENIRQELKQQDIQADKLNILSKSLLTIITLERRCNFCQPTKKS